MTPRRRTLIGRVTGGVTRQSIYRIDDGLEMDDLDHYEITRKRVFFDDVVAMTRHKERGWLLLILLGIVAGLFFFFTVLAWSEPVSAGILAFIALSFAIPAVVRWFLQVDVITVTGRRTRIRMKFAFRKKRAGELFAELSASVRHAQRRAAEQMERQLSLDNAGIVVPEAPSSTEPVDFLVPKVPDDGE